MINGVIFVKNLTKNKLNYRDPIKKPSLNEHIQTKTFTSRHWQWSYYLNGISISPTDVFKHMKATLIPKPHTFYTHNIVKELYSEFSQKVYEMGCCTDNGISIVILVFPISLRSIELSRRRRLNQDIWGEIEIKCHVIHVFTLTQR